MTAKVDAASSVEPHSVEMSGATISSAPSTGTQKVSMFAAKSGFVIPKNKLSGSLVPIFRGSKNLGASDAVSGESKKQIQRKTKWGLDLTQDASVRKGRALAYQVLFGLFASAVLVVFLAMLYYFHSAMIKICS